MRWLACARALGCALPMVVYSGSASAQDVPIPIRGLVVTATPDPRPLHTLGMHVSVLDGAELRARGVLRVEDALREVSGASLARSGSVGGVTSIFLRGGESDYVQVLVDGVQVNQPGGAFDLSGLTMDGIERIEVVRGPASALHGSDAVTGVIHIITRDGAGPERGSLTLQGGSFGSLDATGEVGGTIGAASYGIGVGHHRTDGVLAFNNDFDNTVLAGRMSLRPDERSALRIAARLGARTFHFPTDFSGAVVDRNQRTFSNESLLSVEASRSLSERTSLRLLLSSATMDTGTEDALDDALDTESFHSLDVFERHALDARATWGVGARMRVTAGTEFERQQVRSFSESVSAFGPFNSRSADARSNRAAYAHLAAGTGALDLTFGTRVEHNEQYGRFATWQGGVSVTVTPSLRLRGSVGTGLKEPTFYETFATGFTMGNPDLDPERSFSWEAGLEKEWLDGRLGVQGTYFDQRFRDLIQYTSTPPVPGGANYHNVAEAKARGAEIGGSAVLGAVRVFGDLTWLGTEVVDAGFDRGSGATFVEGEALLRRPDRTGRVGASVRMSDRLALDGTARFVGERSDRDFTTFPAVAITLDEYWLVDVGARMAVLDARSHRVGVELTVRGENLGDRRYEEIFRFPAPGRALHLGGRVVWRGGGVGRD